MFSTNFNGCRCFYGITKTLHPLVTLGSNILNKSIDMSKSIHGGKRSKNARENYVEQLPFGRSITGGMGKKRETFTNIDPLDDGDIAYRSTSNYLRQMAQQGILSPTEMMTARNIPRTKSASETTPRNTVSRSISGNPRYKAQEDYYEEIQIMKKDMKTIKDENSNLRAKIRRLEEDNTRKRKEIDALYDSSKDGDLRRTLAGSTTDRNNNSNNTAAANVVMSLKQRLFKLELQLKQKETTIDELKSDPRWTKGIEYELQNRALLGELERQKAGRLHYIEQNDYDATLVEENKKAVRKLTREKDELQQENQSLKGKVHELEKLGGGGRSSPRSLMDLNDGKHSSKEIEKLKHELNEANKDLQQTQHKLDQVQSELAQANKHMGRTKQSDEDPDEVKRDRDQFRQKLNRINGELDEVKRERDEYREKFDAANEKFEGVKREKDQLKKQLDQANEELERLQEKISKPNRSDRPSPIPMPSRRSPSPKIDEPPKPHSRQKFSSYASTTDDNFEADSNKRHTPSPSNQNAVKNAQASLRGHLNRNEMIKSPGPSAFKQVSPSKLHESTKSPSPVDKGSGAKANTRDDLRSSPTSAFKGSVAKPKIRDDPRSSPSPVDKGNGSKSNIRDDLRSSPTSAFKGSVGKPNIRDDPRSSPTSLDKGNGSKSNIRDDRRPSPASFVGKTGPDNQDRSTRQGTSALSKSPNPSQNVSSGRSARPTSPLPRASIRKSPTASKQSIKETPSDDDDDLVIAGDF